MFQRRTPEVYLSLGVYRIESAPFRCGRCYFKFCLPDNRPGYILPVAVLGEICELLSDNTIVCFAFLFLLSSIFTVQFFLVLQSIQCVIETEDRVFVFSGHVIRFYVCFLGAEGNKNFFLFYFDLKVSALKLSWKVTYIYPRGREHGLLQRTTTGYWAGGGTGAWVVTDSHLHRTILNAQCF